MPARLQPGPAAFCFMRRIFTSYLGPVVCQGRKRNAPGETAVSGRIVQGSVEGCELVHTGKKIIQGSGAAATKSSASGSHWTLRWREVDSNFRFRAISDGGPWSATRSLFKIIQVHPALMPSR